MLQELALHYIVVWYITVFFGLGKNHKDGRRVRSTAGSGNSAEQRKQCMTGRETDARWRTGGVTATRQNHDDISY